MSLSHDFSEWLRRRKPRTGRMLLESGFAFNIADFHRVKQLEEISTQSILGNGYIASVRNNILAGSAADLVFEIPVGTKSYMHAQQISVTGGSIEWQIRMNPDAYTAASTVKGHNLDEEINNQSELGIVTTTEQTTGSEFRREGVMYTQDSGNNVGQTMDVDVAAQSDAIPQYVNDRFPLLRLNNVSADDATVIVTYIWAELPRNQ